MVYIKNPRFWYKKLNCFLYFFLKPISLIYGYFIKKNFSKSYDFASSKSLVIAVGGLTVGGAGKTIITSYLIDKIRKNFLNPAVLTRGYGRTNNKTMAVDTLHNTHKNVGDEALLLSQYTNVFVSKDRYLSALLAEKCGYDALILDDGFMQRSLKPDIFVLVIDGDQGIGNGELLPLGPNRLHIDLLKHKIDVTFIINNDTHNLAKKLSLPNVKYLKIETHVCGIENGAEIFAFCALGYPEKFKNSLKRNYKLIDFIEYPDHYAFKDEDIEHILYKAASFSNANIVTTQKDFVKIPEKYKSYIKCADFIIQD